MIPDRLNEKAASVPDEVEPAASSIAESSAPEASPPSHRGAMTGAHTENERGIPDERGIPSVNRVRSVQARVTAILALALTSLTALGLLGWYYHRALSRPQHADARLHAAARARAQTDSTLPPLGPIHPPHLVAASTLVTHTDGASAGGAMPALLGPPPPLPGAMLITPGVSPVPPGVHTGPQSAVAHESVHRPSRRARDLQRRLGGLVATKASASPTGVGAGSERTAPDAAAQAASDLGTAPRPVDFGAEYPASSRASAPGDALHALLTAQVTPAVEAQVLPTQRFLIPKGAFIDCTLETAIDSTLPGMTTCITATDTFGADGQVVLLERGTKLVGETRGEVEQGKARLFVLWTEARTPTGVVMPLASPATDELGRSGLAGAVNRHFWQRFGAAMLVSVIDGTVQGIALSQEKSGSALIVSPSSSSDIVEEVLRGTVNIPPTVTVAQGSRIEVLVARDLDFRPVYELKLLRARTAAPTSDPSR